MKKMLKHLALFLAVLLMITAMPTVTFAATSTILYVSPTGNDSAEGTLAAPLKTLEGARQKVLAMKTESGLSQEGITVYFQDGTYPVTTSVHFTDEDSGTETARITYKAQNAGKAVFFGGITLDNSKFTDNDEDGIYEYDLSKIADLGIMPYSGNTQTGSYSVELFSNEEPMTVARYPDSGYIEITADDIVANEDNYTLKIPSEKAEAWALEEDGRALGYWSNFYSVVKYKISADTEASTISTNTRQSTETYDLKAGQQYYVYNMLCELDTVGEYYIDRKNSILYYKPVNLTTETLVLSTMADAFIKNTGGKYISFDGLSFEYGRSDAYARFDVTGLNASATGTNITNCNFKNFASRAIYYSGANSEISNNTIKNVNSGIFVSAGNMNTLSKANVLIKGNTISGFSRINVTYTPAINLMGCGITASYNEIYNGPHTAIEFTGNDHVITDNNIHDVLLAAADIGAIYSHIGNNPKNFGFRGTEIKNNYIHHLGIKASSEYQPANFSSAGCNRYAVYLDGVCGDIIKDNIFYETEWGVCVNSGRDNEVKNNLFLEVSYPVLMTSLSAGKTCDLEGNDLKMFLYSGGWGIGEAHKKYSGLYDEDGNLILNGTNFGYPSGNVIESNLAYEAAKSWNFQSIAVCTENDAKLTNTISAPFIDASLTEADFENYGTENVKLTTTVAGFNSEIGIESTEPIEAGTPKIGLYTIGDFRSGNMKEKAMDGDISTSWRGTQNSKTGSWIEMDLNGQYLVSGVNYQGEALVNSNSYGCFRHIIVEVSNDRINYRSVYNNATNTATRVLPFSDGAEYVRYIRLRGSNVSGNFAGEGAAEIYPVFVDATARSYPEIKNGTLGMKVTGTLAAGGTVRGEYFYYNSGAVSEGATKYQFVTSTTSDGKNIKAVASGYTNGKYPEYTLTEKDAGKYIQLVLIPVDENGKEGTRTVSNFYKIADKEKSAEIMTVVNELKSKLDELNVSALTGAFTLPTVDGVTIKYMVQNPAYLKSDGSLPVISDSISNVVPPAENGDSTTYYTATITLSDNTTANYIFPVTLKAKASDTYVSWDYGKGTEDTTLTEEEKTAATHSGKPGNKVQVKTSSGYWGNFRYASLGSWAGNQNTVTDAVNGGYMNLTDNITNWNKTALWIGRMYVKAIPTEMHKGFNFTTFRVSTDNPGYYYEAVNTLSDVSSNLSLKTDEWTEVQVLSVLHGSKQDSRRVNIQFGGSYFPDYVYVDDFTAEPLKVGSVKVEGAEKIQIPDGNVAVTEQYTSTVLNQFGTTLGMTKTDFTPEQTVTYRLKDAVKGVSIDKKTGRLTVTKDAPANTKVIIEAVVDKTKAEIVTFNVRNPSNSQSYNNTLTGAVLPIGAGIVKAEYQVELVNPDGIYSDTNGENALAGEQFTIGMFDDVEVIKENSYKWYVGTNDTFEETELETEVGSQYPFKLYTVELPENIGNKYIKLAVTTSTGNTIYSAPYYITPKVDADQLFVYSGETIKTSLKFSAKETFKGLRNITNNSTSDVSVVMVLARYNSQGKLLAVNYASPVIIGAGLTVPVSVDLAIPENLESGEYLRAFVMSEELSPYDNAIKVTQ